MSSVTGSVSQALGVSPFACQRLQNVSLLMLMPPLGCQFNERLVMYAKFGIALRELASDQQRMP